MTLLPDGLFFEPWIGAEYGKAKNPWPRLLILGDSHYGKEEWQVPDFTRRVVLEQALGKDEQGRPWRGKRSKLFVELATLLLGASRAGDVGEEARERVWNRIAFSNYVQEIVGPEHDSVPTDAMWDTGRRSFGPILDFVGPEAVIVCGWRVWKNLPPCQTEVLHGTEGDPKAWRERTYARPDGGSVRMVRIDHPSSPGWTYERWRPRIEHLLNVEQRGPLGSA